MKAEEVTALSTFRFLGRNILQSPSWEEAPAIWQRKVVGQRKVSKVHFLKSPWVSKQVRLAGELAYGQHDYVARVTEQPARRHPVRSVHNQKLM